MDEDSKTVDRGAAEPKAQPFLPYSDAELAAKLAAAREQRQKVLAARAAAAAAGQAEDKAPAPDPRSWREQPPARVRGAPPKRPSAPSLTAKAPRSTAVPRATAADGAIGRTSGVDAARLQQADEPARASAAVPLASGTARRRPIGAASPPGLPAGPVPGRSSMRAGYLIRPVTLLGVVVVVTALVFGATTLTERIGERSATEPASGGAGVGDVTAGRAASDRAALDARRADADAEQPAPVGIEVRLPTASSAPISEIATTTSRTAVPQEGDEAPLAGERMILRAAAARDAERERLEDAVARLLRARLEEFEHP